MADFYLYANETGNLDLDGASKHGGSAHFGFGTAVFGDRHGDYLWRGLRLRAQLEGEGVRLPKGFHAVNDSTRTRTVMFDELKTQAPRIDATLLLKSNAYDYVRNAGEMRLYKLAWYLHFKHVAESISQLGDPATSSCPPSRRRLGRRRRALHFTTCAPRSAGSRCFADGMLERRGDCR